MMIQIRIVIIPLLLVLLVAGCIPRPEPLPTLSIPITLVNTMDPITPTNTKLPPTWTPDTTPTNTPWPSDTPLPTRDPGSTSTPTERPDIILKQLLGREKPQIKTQLAYASTVDEQLDIFLLSGIDLEPERFIQSSRDDIYPTWSPDGKSLAYLRAGPDPEAFWMEPETDLYLVQNLVQTNLTADFDLFIPELVWSPNSNYIAFSGSEKDPPPLQDASLDIYIANVDKKGSTRILNASGVGCRSLSWAPDNWELVSACRGSMVSGLAIDDRSGENAFFTDFIPAEKTVWMPSGKTIMSYTVMGSLISIPAEYMRQRDGQTYPESTDWDERLALLGYQDKAVRAMEWYPKDDNLFLVQSEDLIQVVDLNRGVVISILGQFISPRREDWDFRPYWDFTGQVSWGPEGEQIAFAYFDGYDAEIGIVNIRTKVFSKVTDNLVDDLMPSWKQEP